MKLMEAGRANPSIVAAMVAPIVCPIWRLVSITPDAKLLSSGRLFIIMALLGALKVCVPMNAGPSKIGSTQIGTWPENRASKMNPEAIANNPPGRIQRGFDLSK